MAKPALVKSSGKLAVALGGDEPHGTWDEAGEECINSSTCRISKEMRHKKSRRLFYMREGVTFLTAAEYGQ
jgi:hypothetical protein